MEPIEQQGLFFQRCHIHIEPNMMGISFIVGFATVVGTSEGIKASMAKSRREEHRSRKNNVIVHVPKSSEYSQFLEGRSIVLSGDRVGTSLSISSIEVANTWLKIYIDTGRNHDRPFGHPFEGYFLPYPDSRYSGLVSTITDEAPIMNWIFVDRDTYRVRFGNRLASEGHHTGPWDSTRQDHRLIFGGWEGFCVVYEDGVWGLYFDMDGDKLRNKLGDDDQIVIEVDLVRRELKTKRPQYATPQEAQQTSEKQSAAGIPEQRDSSRETQKTEQSQQSQQSQQGAQDYDRPEQQASRSGQDDDARSESGFSGVTYAEGIEELSSEPRNASPSRNPESPTENAQSDDTEWEDASVYTQDPRSSGRYSGASAASRYQPSEEEMEGLCEDVD
jgi:hypothetical protein